MFFCLVFESLFLGVAPKSPLWGGRCLVRRSCGPLVALSPSLLLVARGGWGGRAPVTMATAFVRVRVRVWAGEVDECDRNTQTRWMQSPRPKPTGASCSWCVCDRRKERREYWRKTSMFYRLNKRAFHLPCYLFLIRIHS